MEPERVIDRLGGLAAAHELRHAGITRPALESALGDRRVIRIRQGWYARARLDDRLAAAARVGGRATCATALAIHGVWSPRDDRVHVAVPRNACQLRSPADKRRRRGPTDAVRVHWTDDESGASRLVVEPLDALRHLDLCADRDDLVLSADSLLRLRPDLRESWPETVRMFASGTAIELAQLDGICESGSETRFWMRTRTRIPGLRRQVSIPGVGRVDFLVGRLVIEIDGAAYHTDPARFENDRRRDAELSRRGYRVLRFSYRQVMHDWPSVENAVLAALSRGDHR